MCMLEDLMEAPVLQRGLQAFLADHAYGNASWDELVETLDKEAPTVGIRQFSDVWVKQKGMPNIHVTYQNDKVIVSQTDPYGRGLVWRQKFQIKLIYDLGTSRTLTVDMDKPTVSFKVVKAPDYIIPNYDGRGYGNFTVDDNYAKKLPLRLITTRNDLNRQCLLQTIHDNYLMGNITPSYFGELYRMMIKEKNPLIMSTAIDHMFKIASDMTIEQRKTLELCMMDLLGENRSKECRLLIIRKLAANAISKEVLDKIAKILYAHNDPLFNEHDYMDMAYRLAIVRPDQRHDILKKERAHLKTEELRNEFDYVSQACNPNAEARTKVFNNLLKPENRKHEPWALHLLRLLNSDVYEPQSNDYIAASIKSLPYIQQTSDIFFPGNWMKALLSGHKSKEASWIVENTLKSESGLSENLRNKVLEAAWVLMKQKPYVEKAKPVVVKKANKSTKK